MDRREFEKLNNINRSIPRDLIRNLIRNEKPMAYEKAKMEDIASNRRLPLRAREEAKRMLNEHAKEYDKTVQVVDDKVAKQIEKHVDREFQRKVRSGEIKPVADQWAKKQMTEKRLSR